ncbi:MAG: LpxL/LpxP family Kdo(2)-lipid IV(A) lauroyl/palmitoleoyl acyltransferase [Xanthomonadales bacterium]|nr:LpxL/LpxP family Kdo(2)-lipid IV(A) lauroyl/palmitoleoyl acyltransferase [Xanthomonadales bacterium]
MANPLPFPRALLAPQHWPAWFGIGWMALFARLPGAIARPLGRGFGNCLGWVLRGRRRVARRNLELCFPELDRDHREAILRRSLRSLGEGAYEFARAWWGSVASLPYTIEGLEHLERARAEGRGVLLLSGHFLTLEICGRLLCSHIELAGMYRRHGAPAFEWAVKRGRLRYACAMFAREELRAAVKHVKAGGCLWYAPDQDMRGKDTVFAPFFGVPASTITATFQLARLTRASVIPFFHQRDGRGGYVLRIGAALTEIAGEDEAAHTARVNALIEQMVRAAPDEYLWIHKRFKSRPAGEPALY